MGRQLGRELTSFFKLSFWIFVVKGDRVYDRVNGIIVIKLPRGQLPRRPLSHLAPQGVPVDPDPTGINENSQE